MRRSASEIIRNLEVRVARLERTAAPYFERTWSDDEYPPQDVMNKVVQLIKKDLRKEGISFEVKGYNFIIDNGEEFLLDFMQTSKFDKTSKSNAKSIHRNPGIGLVIVNFYNVQMSLEYGSVSDKAYLKFYYDRFSESTPWDY